MSIFGSIAKAVVADLTPLIQSAVKTAVDEANVDLKADVALIKASVGTAISDEVALIKTSVGDDIKSEVAVVTSNLTGAVTKIESIVTSLESLATSVTAIPNTIIGAISKLPGMGGLAGLLGGL